jgi:hypothetical protein
MRWHDKIPYEEINNPLVAMGKKLRGILEKAVKLKQYKRGYPNNRKYAGGNKLVTYCNVFARDILDRRCSKTWIMGWLIGGDHAIIETPYDYDITCLNKSGKIKSVLLGTSPGGAYRNAEQASLDKKIESVTMPHAQQLANQGIPVWVTSEEYCHEAIVCPDFNTYFSKKGCLIAQAGWVNGIMYISDKWAWGKNFQDPEIKFYYFPEYK